jgi:signal transduction histidine kinase/CheY-like chemotaxis protein/HPt (histidine-containing phosphotransfer) domain-containing protein
MQPKENQTIEKDANIDSSADIDVNALQEEVNALKKENRALNRKLKETGYLVSSYEQYAVFQKSIYESIKKQKNEQDIYLRLIFSHTPDIILVLDMARMYVMGTKRTMRTVGIDSDALTGKDFSAIFSPVMPDVWVKAMLSSLQTVIDTGEHIKHANYPAVIGGNECYHEINIIPFKDGDDQMMGVIFFIHDETELHEAMRAAERSNHAKTNFLAKISHEIRTPMNAIAGMSELILREQTTGLVREHALSIKQASGNLMAIINDVLDFSKIESGKLEVIEAEYLFSSLINDVISIIRMRVIDKQIFFITNVDCDVPNKLMGDEIRIRQILLNLLGNAFKYCEQGFISIHVSCENTDGDRTTLVLDISDSGVGIRQEDRDKLFSDFVQLDRVANREVEGTGLGLVITKSLCEAMGGSISLYSNYGKGSTFTVKIPQKFNFYEKFASIDDADAKKALIYETREAYANSIICSIDSLGVECTLVSNQSKFLETLNKDKFTHVFVSSFLFESTEKIIRNLGIDITMVLLAEYGESAINTKDVKTLEMPVHSITIANLLNGGTAESSYAENIQCGIRFIAPSAYILLVDDLITNLRVAEGLMLPYGMQIDVCRGGAEAIELVKHNIYDMVFMDHMMPDVDGVEATLAIRKLEGSDYFKKLPIVALTANAVSGVKEMFLQNGFNDFLAKPIEMVKLNAILEAWLPKDKLEPYIQKESDACAPDFEIQGIDVKSGMFMTGGNIPNYLRALSAFYKDGIEKAEQFGEHSKTGNMKLYAACAHAVKGAAASIGAAKLSSFAKALELAAKNADIDYVRKNNGVFSDEFGALLKNISYVIAANGKNCGKDKADSIPLICEYVMKLKNALINFDIETADTILTDLQSESWDDETNEALERIATKILICEYDQALEIVERMINSSI